GSNFRNAAMRERSDRVDHFLPISIWACNESVREVNGVIKPLISTSVGGGCNRGAAVMMRHQRMPTGIGIDHGAEFVNEVQKHFFSPSPGRLADVPGAGHEIRLSMLKPESCRFVCSERHSGCS